MIGLQRRREHEPKLANVNLSNGGQRNDAENCSRMGRNLTCGTAVSGELHPSVSP
jgi:hypothetical protein